MIHFQPEPIEDLAARYPDALTPLFDPDPMPRPGELREHVFDFPDGMRLIVSRDRVVDDAVENGNYLHLSGTFEVNSDLHREIKAACRHESAAENLDIAQAMFRQRVEARFPLLASRAVPRCFVGVSVGGAFHWIEKEQ